MSSTPRRTTTAGQFVKLLCGLLAVCLAGGALLASLALPWVGTAGTAVNAGVSIFKDLPTDLGFTEPSEQSVLLASDGTQLANFYAENRIVVASDQISDYMKKAAVAIEDRRFYQHHGVDVQGLARAFLNNVAGNPIAGGSTITQQYVKNALVEQGRVSDDADMIAQATERSISRKINEARIAVAIERTMSKDEILTGYLNLAQFGIATYGVEAAARHYFSKSAKDLTIVEAATLAGITQSPSKWDPIRHPDNAFKRRNIVLNEMAATGAITEEERDAAKAIPVEETLHVSEVSNGCAAAGISAYFCEYVVKSLLNDPKLGEDKQERTKTLYRGGLVIHTTLDPAKQQAAYNSLVNNVPVNDSSRIQTAMTSLEPSTGHVLAMAQNTNYGERSEADPTATHVNLNVGQDMGGGVGFQSGSTFKIFTLVEWLKQGHTAYERVNSAAGLMQRNEFKASCAPEALDKWNVHNLEGTSRGMMTVLESTRQSTNGSFAHMAAELDLCDIADTAFSMGVKLGKTGGNWHYGPSMVLGSNNITPISMAEAVATLSNDGVHCNPLPYSLITTTDGDKVSEPQPTCKRALSEEVARETTAVLSQVVTNGATGERAQVPGYKVAGKTGTANRDTDAWFVGYTPNLAAAYWQGHQGQQKSMFHSRINGRYYSQVYGGLIAAKMFSDYMKVALRGTPAEDFTAPARAVISNPASAQRSSRAEDGESVGRPASDSAHETANTGGGAPAERPATGEAPQGGEGQ